jgi:hypothetical protein
MVVSFRKKVNNFLAYFQNRFRSKPKPPRDGHRRLRFPLAAKNPGKWRFFGNYRHSAPPPDPALRSGKPAGRGSAKKNRKIFSEGIHPPPDTPFRFFYDRPGRD